MSITTRPLTALALVAAVAGPTAAQETAAPYDVGAMMMATDGSDAEISAATGWHICSVVRTGAGWGNHYVALTCPSGPFTNTWHIMNNGQKDAMLATALAAATSNSKVQVAIAAASGYNQINALYIHK